MMMKPLRSFKEKIKARFQEKHWIAIKFFVWFAFYSILIIFIIWFSFYLNNEYLAYDERQLALKFQKLQPWLNFLLAFCFIILILCFNKIDKYYFKSQTFIVHLISVIYFVFFGHEFISYFYFDNQQNL